MRIDFTRRWRAPTAASPAITASNRIPAVKLTVRQQLEVTEPKRQDRQPDVYRAAGRRQAPDQLSNCRTLPDELATRRRQGRVTVRCFRRRWADCRRAFAGGTAASVRRGGRLAFAAPHGLSAGQAVSSGGEIRFVAAIVDANTVQLNAPFTAPPAAGAPVGATVTYAPATELPSVEHLRLLEPGDGGAATAVRSGRWTRWRST